MLIKWNNLSRIYVTGLLKLVEYFIGIYLEYPTHETKTVTFLYINRYKYRKQILIGKRQID